MQNSAHLLLLAHRLPDITPVERHLPDESQVPFESSSERTPPSKEMRSELAHQKEGASTEAQGRQGSGPLGRRQELNSSREWVRQLSVS